VANELGTINSERTLTQEQYRDLADFPPELESLANITNAKTRRAYKVDVAEFIAFTNLRDHSAFRTVARSHVIAWRKDMESRSLAPTSICVHSMRATAATNALSNEADIAKVQEWLGHANVSTTRLYDRRKTRPEDSPTFHAKY
jgi:site-specific recombinase XerD